ncbi:phosphoglucan phosphatase LSF1, chloroplastic [Coffea eugenioides]|uniref:phosphoglucan phosphatase LSF1, chloroplastic n=1 Tax=Coffea eugenioides TaxID=49369 RepID=UPI000F61370F|nr:phosphoglucan phosphatase LSF1, chloroplastic [Coffea eugenioides]
MCSLQIRNCRGPYHSPFTTCFSYQQLHVTVIHSSFWGKGLCSGSNGSSSSISATESRFSDRKRPPFRVFAMSPSSSTSGSAFRMNLNEYMVTLEKPLGIRFALSVDGKIFVHALKKGGNAEKSRIIMVGDTLKKASESSSSSSGGGLIEIKDFGDTERMMKEKSGTCSLVLERPFSPFPVHRLFLMNDLDILFNRGRVPLATWNKNILTSNLRCSTDGGSNSGFVTFSSKYVNPRGWKILSDQNKTSYQQMLKNNGHAVPLSPLVTIFFDEESAAGEWAHGSFPLDEYVMALDRASGELYYNHSLGMRYSKITEQIYVGSCIQAEADVESLATTAGITAVLNFQSGTEAENWGISSKVINETCQRCNILMINYPIREVDSFDTRKKLPFCVGLLLRLLKKNHRVYVTCTTGFDRSPACVIAYLHWMTDTSLHAAYNFVTGLHSCKPDRAAIAWATWDLIARVESGRHDGPATHAVTFVWNGHEGEDVYLVGDFTGNWKEPIKAVHKGGPRFEVEVRLPQGKYYYKYVVSEQWRHSTSSPTERDERGNVNNVIVIGDIASVRPSAQQQKKDANIVKVIERPLTENERFMLAKAARCVAFSVCPIKLAPK